jgi:hypothetical protein
VGWTPLGMSGDDGVLDTAIIAANAGELVVAGYFQPPIPRPDGTQVQGAGRIVVVRPQESFPSDEGPQVVTAGVQNFKSASMRFAFGDHPLAWPDNIQLFIHDTALELGWDSYCSGYVNCRHWRRKLELNGVAFISPGADGIDIGSYSTTAPMEYALTFSKQNAPKNGTGSQMPIIVWSRSDATIEETEVLAHI